MPLLQSLLDFKVAFSTVGKADAALESITRTRLSRKTSGSSSVLDADPVTVKPSRRSAQLPTPSESASDVSSQASTMASMKEVPKGRGKRVKERMSLSQSEEYIQEDDSSNQKNRSVSGETLVNTGNSSNDNLVKDGVATLNIPWNMSNVFEKGSKAELLRQDSTNQSVESFETITVNEQDDSEKHEKAAARKVRMDELARTREEKRKAADEKATRRSSRASILNKAGDLVSDITANVLGKRKDRSDESASLSRSRSVLVPTTSEDTLIDSESKKRRLSESDLPPNTGSSSRKSSKKAGDKKWLASGLYAGQPRTFDGRLNESKNKRKSVQKDSTPQPENTVLPLPMFAGERLLKQGRDFKLPFDVFSPLPAGQPKPDEWRKTNKNVFVGEAAQEWRTSKFIEHSTCMCRPETGCDHNCMNRFMYYECDERNCNLNEDNCGNRSFEGLRQRSKKGGKYNVGVEVIKTADRGYGVRSNRTFDPHQIIVEYTGEIITQEECESRMRTIYKDNECYYLMLFDQNMIIDATRGSIARFVNHACEPNCRMEKWTVGGKPRMALFAGDRGVMTGEELTYDYNFDPYSQKNVQECRCGSKNCRGVLGPKPKPNLKEKEKEEKESKLNGVKRKVTEALDDSTNALNKKRKILVPKSKSSNKASPKSSKVTKVSIVRRTLTKQITSKKVVASPLARRPSKLKRVLAATKEVTTSSKSQSRRVVSTGSGRQALIPKKQALGRTSSLKAKADGLKKSINRTMRGK